MEVVSKRDNYDSAMDIRRYGMHAFMLFFYPRVGLITRKDLDTSQMCSSFTGAAYKLLFAHPTPQMSVDYQALALDLRDAAAPAPQEQPILQSAPESSANLDDLGKATEPPRQPTGGLGEANEHWVYGLVSC